MHSYGVWGAGPARGSADLPGYLIVYFDASEMDDEPASRMQGYRRRAQPTQDHMWEVFHSVPKML